MFAQMVMCGSPLFGNLKKRLILSHLKSFDGLILPGKHAIRNEHESFAFTAAALKKKNDSLNFKCQAQTILLDKHEKEASLNHALNGFELNRLKVELRQLKRFRGKDDEIFKARVDSAAKTLLCCIVIAYLFKTI